MKQVVKYNNVDFAKISFSKPLKNEDRIYESKACLSPQQSCIFIQTPDMNIREFLDVGNVRKSQVDLEISDDTFYQLLRHIDAHIVGNIFESRQAWFPNKEISMAMIEDYYKSPILKQVDSDVKLPVIRINMNCVNEKIHTTYFVNKAVKAIEDLSSGMKVAAIIQLRGLKMYKGSINPDWVVHTFRSTEAIEKTPKFKELLGETEENDR